MFKKVLFSFLFITASFTWAGNSIDSTQINSIVKKVKKPKDPIKASLLSSIIPGAGQIYNRKWWKAPIVWGGFISAIIVHDFYYDKHKFYHQILIYKDQQIDETTIANYADNNKEDDRFTNLSGAEIAALNQSQIQILNDAAEKRKQQVYLMSAMFYILQIVDASVDAHFSKFDISDDLSLQIKPSLIQHQTSLSAGIKFNFSLR